MHVIFVYIYYFHGYIFYHLLCSIFMYCYHVLSSCTVFTYCSHVLFMYYVHVLISYTVCRLYFHITFSSMPVNTKEVDTGNYKGPEGVVLTVRNSGLIRVRRRCYHCTRQ